MLHNRTEPSRQDLRRRERRLRRNHAKLSENLTGFLSSLAGYTVIGTDPVFSYLAAKHFSYAEVLAVCQVLVQDQVTTVVAVPARYWDRPSVMAMLQAVRNEMAGYGRNCRVVSPALIDAWSETLPGSAAPDSALGPSRTSGSASRGDAFPGSSKIEGRTGNDNFAEPSTAIRART